MSPHNEKAAHITKCKSKGCFSMGRTGNPHRGLLAAHRPPLTIPALWGTSIPVRKKGESPHGLVLTLCSHSYLLQPLLSHLARPLPSDFKIPSK